MNDSKDKISKIQKEALETFVKKNSDYGQSYDVHGIVGVLVRIHDKLLRMENITKKGITLVEDEKLRDTLLDCHNYCAIAIMLLDKDDK